MSHFCLKAVGTAPGRKAHITCDIHYDAPMGSLIPGVPWGTRASLENVSLSPVTSPHSIIRRSLRSTRYDRMSNTKLLRLSTTTTMPCLAVSCNSFCGVLRSIAPSPNEYLKRQPQYPITRWQCVFSGFLRRFIFVRICNATCLKCCMCAAP